MTFRGKFGWHNSSIELKDCEESLWGVVYAHAFLGFKGFRLSTEEGSVMIPGSRGRSIEQPRINSSVSWK